MASHTTGKMSLGPNRTTSATQVRRAVIVGKRPKRKRGQTTQSPIVPTMIVTKNLGPGDPDLQPTGFMGTEGTSPVEPSGSMAKRRGRKKIPVQQMV